MGMGLGLNLVPSSAIAAHAKGPEARPAATSPNMARRLVSVVSAETCCWALMLRLNRVGRAKRVLLGPLSLEPLSLSLIHI